MKNILNQEELDMLIQGSDMHREDEENDQTAKADADFVEGAPKEKFVKTYYARWFVKMRVLYELIRDNPNFEKVLWFPIYDKCGELYSWGMIVFREDGSAIKITNRECIKIFDNLFDYMDYKLLMGKIQGE